MSSELQLIVDLHVGRDRQGPGGTAETLRAIDLAQLPGSTPLRVADLGCGTGAATLVLAKTLKADIAAVDLFPEFLETLNSRASKETHQSRITTHCCSMSALPFKDEEFDVIWSEGAIYNIGFEMGVASLKRFLKPGGKLVVSELTWLTNDRPEEIQRFWQKEYPEIGTAASKVSVLEANGYAVGAHFALPKSCWLTNYYGPLENGFGDFLKRQGNSKAAENLVDATRQEITLYDRFGDYYGYAFYVARKSA